MARPDTTAAARAAWRSTLPNGSRPDTAPAYWPFGQLTPQQQRRHAAQVRAMRDGLLARWPEGLL